MANSNTIPMLGFSPHVFLIIYSYVHYIFVNSIFSSLSYFIFHTIRSGIVISLLYFSFILLILIRSVEESLFYISSLLYLSFITIRSVVESLFSSLHLLISISILLSTFDFLLLLGIISFKDIQ